MNISTIILTYNAEKQLPELLEKLFTQTVQNNEIIVVDSSSKDGTKNIALSFGVKLIVIPKNKFDHGGTRTFASKISKGDFIIFFTQDAIPYDKFTIEKILNPFFSDSKIGATYGKQVPYDDTNIFGKHLRYFNYPDTPIIKKYEDKNKSGIKTAFISNSFAAYNRNILEKVGWFKNNLILGEDTFIGAKILMAGYKIMYNPEAKVYHSHSYSNFQTFKRYFDIGVFHKSENWIIKTFGKPNNEGLKYVKSEINFIIKEKTYHLLFNSIIRNLFKFIGYKLGYNFRRLPFFIIKKFSFHKDWWLKNNSIFNK